MDANCRQIAEKRTEKHRVEPGGYFANQKLDEIAMYNADVLRSIDAITGISAPRDEIYRVVARICDQVHKSDKVLTELKMIYK